MSKGPRVLVTGGSSGDALERQLHPDDLVAAFDNGLERSDDEIAPGRSRQSKWMSPLAPGFIFGRLDNETSR